MSTNGHAPHGLPPGAKIATFALIEAHSRAWVKCPALSERAGEELYVQIRPIGRAAYLRMLPPPIPGSESWGRVTPDVDADPQLWEEQYRSYLAGLPIAEREQRMTLAASVTYKVLVAGMAEPRVTMETATEFADDADHLASEILIFSKLITRTTPPQVEAAGAETAAAEASPAA